MKNPVLRILSIDDDPSCQRVVAQYMTIVGGHMVETALNGSEGLKKAADIKPDVILLDMAMPDMSGAEVLESLHSDPATRHIPVVILTGSELMDSGSALYKNTNLKHIAHKPAIFEDLLRKIETLLLHAPGASDTGPRPDLTDWKKY
ncbi:MAG: response regulator [Elusimicrobia bacterium]|nr:response regulator [Elusimicrobiota bacterium]